MNKSIIIIGAGPGFGLAVAEKFGKEGYAVGLISRNAVKLASMCEEIKNKSIRCAVAIAAGSQRELETAISSLKTELGGVSVLLYNAAVVKNKDIFEETADVLVEDFRINVANALYCAQLLHDDLKTNSGAFLLTGGGLSKFPNPQYGSLALGKAGILSLAIQLNKRLKEDNIFVGTITINGFIRKGSPTHSPEILANKLWTLFLNRSAVEVQH
jgi:short-subunit dehydrogenase